MCYDIKASLEAQKYRAQRSGNLDAAQEIETLLRKHTKLPQSHLSGFDHPILGIYTHDNPYAISLGRWGLIPHWFQGRAEELKFNTLNARSEGMLEKAAYAEAAEHYRGILMIDGFYEHQHHSSGIYPYYIYRKDLKPIALACIYQPAYNDENKTSDSEQNRDKNAQQATAALSFSIVTIKANELMSSIHNNPKLKEARMPLILNAQMQEQWLLPELHKSEAFTQSVMGQHKPPTLNQEFILQSHEIQLDCHTVAPLRHKRKTLQRNAALNAERDASTRFDYPELSPGWDLFSGLN